MPYIAAKWFLLLAGHILNLAQAGSAPSFPLQTSGRFIVDANGKRVRLKCVNWYGAHLEQMAANGLNRVRPGVAAQTISESGFNCVRLPFSLDGVIGNFSRVPDPKVSLAASPELQDLSPLEVFDATVNELTQHGVMVILNNHVSTSMWCCSLSDGEGMWYTEKYPDSFWLDALSLMAERYKDNPLVIGFDLRNEVRPSGNHWPQWGGNHTATDWPRAATEAAKRVLEKNDNMLVIVSGLYFSIFLCQVPTYPLHSEVPFLEGRLVYTAHEYEWFNFHLAVRKGIQLYAILILAAFPICWFALCAVGLFRRSGVCRACPIRCPCRSASREADSRRGCCRSCISPQGYPCVQFSSAALLAALCAISLKIVPQYMQRCDIHGVYAAVICGVLTPACALISVLLWFRAAFLLFFWREERAAVQFELSVLSEHGIPQEESLQAELESQRNGCGMPQHAKGCRSMRCMLVIVLIAMACALLGAWHEAGQYEAFARELDFKWGFLQSPTAGQPVPVWLGEFGTNNPSLWWQHILRYLAENDLDFAYWSVNGEKYNGKSETFGLFDADFVTVQQPWKLEQLQAAMGIHDAPVTAVTKLWT